MIATPVSATGTNEISRLRDEMQQIDDELVRTIARRCELARALGAVKAERDIPVIDTVREASVVRRAAECARNAGIQDEAVRHIFWCLIELARRSQTDARLNEPRHE